MANTCWWFYFSKFTEFFDTLFFILRKKNSHVSTLHVIHHGCMPFSIWMGLKFAPGKIFYNIFIKATLSENKFLVKIKIFFLFKVATVHFLHCSMHSFISSCISTIWLLRWDLNIKNTFGGKNTSPPFKWYV